MMKPDSSLADKDRAFVLHPYTHLERHQKQGPMIIERGQGVFVYDDSGRGYIEALAGLWCATLGFSEERLIEAATRQMRKLPFYHGFSHKAHPPMIELAERLIHLAPVPMSKVFFTSSGSEANDTAIKLIWRYNNAVGRPHKKKIISRIKAYHGVTVATTSLTALPLNHRDFDAPLDRFHHTDCPHHYRFGLPGESEEAFSARLADSLEQLILREGPDTIAAFFAEPVMGAGGVITPPSGYFEKIQKVLQHYDVLMVVDEVICGFGRTGAQFGSQTFGINPDIMTLAKGLSAAYQPIAAVLISEPIYQALERHSEQAGPLGHGHTYSGHPVAAAVALETLNIYQERNILDHVRNVSPHFQAGLRMFADHPLVGEVRGVGLLGALELVADKTTRRSFEVDLGMGARVVASAQEQGLILRAMGDSLAFAPPLIISKSEIDEMFRRLRAAIDQVKPESEE
ncbi:Putrescine--pyruvate aminotransferase [Azospirillaceae bacterium]